MISFHRHTLSNGMRLLVHEDATTPMAVVNLLYNVGARDEEEDKTGFAHLFEHLMFAGSKNVASFDEALQLAGGNNNAFTTNDFTNYYEIIPATNLETALWVESDRMHNLNINERTLSVQRNVVMEEFKEHYLNQPYGDASHLLRELAYKIHPYKWPTIGKELGHIEKASLPDVQSFFNRYYDPANAILVVAGGVDARSASTVAEKWFGSIPLGNAPTRNYAQEAPQKEARRKEVFAEVPFDALYISLPVGGRMSQDFYTAGVLAELLGSGRSSRLYQRLVKNKQVFTGIECYLSGSIDPGQLMVEGHLYPNISPQQAEDALWEEFADLRSKPASEREMGKIQNRIEHDLAAEETDLMSRAFHLAFFEMLGDAAMLNHEAQKFRSVTAQDVQALSSRMFDQMKSSTLVYRRTNPNLN
jgi:predicted Zn-dependent peptidase